MISTETRVRRTRFAVAACLAIAAALASGTAAPAHAAWSPYVNIAKPQGTAFLPRVAMDPAGDAVFMWQVIEPDGIYTRSVPRTGP